MVSADFARWGAERFLFEQSKNAKGLPQQD